MVEFSRYYINFMREIFTNLGNFFRKIFEALGDVFYRDIKVYIDNLIKASEKFNLIDWAIFFIVTIINLIFVAFVFIRLYQYLRKYIRFVKREVEKDELLEEISLLNLKTSELIDEKNKILAMKVSTMGGGVMPSYQDEVDEEFGDSEEVVETESRFIKLIEVDEEYKDKITTVTMTDEDTINLEQLVDRFVNFAASQLGLYYSKKTIAIFIAGMATSRLMILEGISGTGKTSLPYAMGKFFNNDASIISVQPAWRDRTELIGYLNEFTKKFNESDFLKSVYEATYREDLSFIILDEMNLARVEYYFAEFLSIMEMPNPDEWKIEIVPNDQPGDPINLEGGKLKVPYNLWFVGTANKDDSTFTITDKVYDRAIPIVMNTKAEYIDAPYTNSITMSYEYLDSLFRDAEANNKITPKTLDSLMKLDLFITAKFKITFGNRIMKQIRQFIPIYVACGRSELEGLDYLCANKIFRKFESLNLAFLHDEIDELIILIDKLFGKDNFVESISLLESYKSD